MPKAHVTRELGAIVLALRDGDSAATLTLPVRSMMALFANIRQARDEEPEWETECELAGELQASRRAT